MGRMHKADDDGQDKTRQDKTRQDKTRQDKTRQSNFWTYINTFTMS